MKISEVKGRNILRTLVNNGNKLAISEITAFELLSGEIKDDIKDYLFNFVNYIARVPVEKDCLQNAMMLAGEYRKLCNNKKTPNIDLIIGGTVMYHKDVLLLTADRTDFCEPLWNTFAREYFFNKNKEGIEKAEVIFYLLEFDRSIFVFDSR